MLILIIILAILLILAGYFIATKNKLTTAKNNVDQAYGDIDVQLQRRNDLIPNLVNTVKGYAKHEKETLTELTRLRSTVASQNATPDEKFAAANKQTKLLNNLIAVAENYPNLKANENFEQLQQELTTTEDKIGYARQYYNSIVGNYNNLIIVFPSSIVANMSHLEKMPYFKADEAARKPVKVEF